MSSLCCHYHGKAHIGFFQSRPVIGSVSGYRDDLSLLYNAAVNDSYTQHTETYQCEAGGFDVGASTCTHTPTFDQGVLVGWRGASQHTKFGPDFVDAFLFNLKVKQTGRLTSKTI